MPITFVLIVLIVFTVLGYVFGRLDERDRWAETSKTKDKTHIIGFGISEERFIVEELVPYFETIWVDERWEIKEERGWRREKSDDERHE